MCQFTLQKYIDCGHTKLLTDALNTLFCKPVATELQRSNVQGLDVTPACCHPLPLLQGNKIAAVHELFGVCEDCQREWISKIQQVSNSKADLILSRQALREDLDFDTYNQEDEEKIGKLRTSINEAANKARQTVQDFEVALNNDTTRLDLDENLQDRQKYEASLLKGLADCDFLMETFEHYKQQCVPRRMFDDMLHYIEKKIVRAAERTSQLETMGVFIVADAGSGNHKEAIASLFSEIRESAFVERYGFAPQRSSDFDYRNERQEDNTHIISYSENEAKRLIEIEVVTSQYVPAKRNNAGSALYDFPMRQRDFGARLAMSNATFSNDKLPDIMRQRNLTVAVTNVLLPHIAAEEAVREAKYQAKLEKQNLRKEELLAAFREKYSLYEEETLDADTATSPDDERTPADLADGSKLPASEPAHDIWIKHEKFTDVDRPSLTSKEAITLALRCDYPFDDKDDWECDEVRQETAQASSDESSQPAPHPNTEAVGRTFSCDFYDDEDDWDEEQTLVELSEELDMGNPPSSGDIKIEEDKDTSSTATGSTNENTSPLAPKQSPSPALPNDLGPIVRKRTGEQDLSDDETPSQKARTSSYALSDEETLMESGSSSDGNVDVDTTAESTPAAEDVPLPPSPAQDAADLPSEFDDAVDVDTPTESPVAPEKIALPPSPVQGAADNAIMATPAAPDEITSPTTTQDAARPSPRDSTSSPPSYSFTGPRAPIVFGAATPLAMIVRKRRSEDKLTGDESPARKERMIYE